MKKLLLIVLALSMLLSLCACGGKDAVPSAEDSPTNQTADAPEQEVAPEEPVSEENVSDGSEDTPVNQTIDAPEQEAVPEEPVSEEDVSDVSEDSIPDIEVIEIAIGDTLSTEFVEMTFENVIVAENIKYSVTTGNSTRTTGPEPISGQQYICISGKIVNTSKSSLPVYDFFIGDIDIDGYIYSVSASDCDILDGEGAPVYSIDPLMEYVFRIYTAIPETLASSYASANFHFGFYDSFDNEELAMNMAFEEDPISLCPYQYILSVTQDDITVNDDSTEEDDAKTEENNAETEEEYSLWQTRYYVDNFNQPTDEGYVSNLTYFIGSFNNSATTDSLLYVEVVVDEEDITFFLYEYGRNQVKNSSSSYDDIYNITMRTDDGTDYNFTGVVYCGGDRLFIDQTYVPEVIAALSQDGNTSFYIEDAERITTNYLFTITSSNFAKQYAELFQ